MDEKKELKLEIKKVVKSFLEKTKGKEIQIISHFDTDGISSAAIMIQSLSKIDQSFSLQIIKSLDNNFIDGLNKDKPVLFIDLASGSLNHLRDSGVEQIYIIDHHEITQEIPKNVKIINPELSTKEKISSSGLVYLFCKEIDEKNKEFAKLAILGMIGDSLGKEIDSLNHGILEEGEIKVKKGLLIYPSTRPLNRVLEYSSNPYIPGVTGDPKGVTEILRETDLYSKDGKIPSLIELTEEEMQRLTTAIILRNPKTKERDLIGKIFLLKFFGKLEDAREISGKINAASRDGKPETALGFCMENQEARRKIESIHVKYKQQLVSGLRFAQDETKIEGPGYVILNAQEKIKDTMIGTIMSILTNSSIYEDGTIMVGLSQDKENKKIKVSTRVVGKKGRNLRELLTKVMEEFEGEVGGHKYAAGCSFSIGDEERFIKVLIKNLELQVVKI